MYILKWLVIVVQILDENLLVVTFGHGDDARPTLVQTGSGARPIRSFR